MRIITRSNLELFAYQSWNSHCEQSITNNIIRITSLLLYDFTLEAQGLDNLPYDAFFCTIFDEPQDFEHCKSWEGRVL